MVLCGRDRTGQVYQPTRRNVRRQRSALTRVACLMYCMIFCVFGFVFPICDAVTTISGVHPLFTEIFHILIFIVAITFLTYFFAHILRQGGSKLAARSKDSLKGQENGHSLTDLDKKKSEVAHNGRESIEPEIRPNEQSSIERGPPLSLAEEGLNLYTRVGTILFAIGAVLLKIFRITEVFSDDIHKDCTSVLYIPAQVIYMIFMVLQTAFIFKFHQIVINKHKPFVRICLMHLIATNLSVWLSGCTSEIVEDVGDLIEERQGMQENVTIRCHHVDTLADRAAPYVFPCLIEYSLIAAAAAFRMYLNVGKVMDDEDGSEAEEQEAASEPREEMLTSFKSLCGGWENLTWMLSTLVVSLAIICGVIIFLVMREQNEDPESHTASYIYLITDILGIVSCFIAVIFAYRAMRELKFHPLDADSFDDKLLLLAQAGFFAFVTMQTISSISDLGKTFRETTYLYLLKAIVNFVQSGVQTVFVLDSLRRCAGHEDQVRNTPGRAQITFLIVVNLALWFVNTFEMEKADESGLKVRYFDRLSWAIMSHMLVPLVIFYRYHTTVCLSDVWSKAYERKKDK